FAFIDACNEFVQSKKPWETHDKKVLYQLVEAIREITKLLEPFIPESAQKIQKIFNTDKIKKAPILFEKIEGEQKTIKEEIPNKTMENVTQIQFEDFTKVKLQVAKIKEAEDIDGADKLYKLTLDDGTPEPRTICAGIKEFYNKEDLKNKSIIIVANLAPRKLKGIESKGMLLAASSKDHKTVSLISPDQEISPGSIVG
ncbi:MAG: methionine--tRNA ligase subunit beta, partial [Nanoarchaeota archaeon]|nr:methionine--tRNA ligase subunit beta [Nanoarchaeota archaeon]